MSPSFILDIPNLVLRKTSSITSNALVNYKYALNLLLSSYIVTLSLLKRQPYDKRHPYDERHPYDKDLFFLNMMKI